MDGSGSADRQGGKQMGRSSRRAALQRLGAGAGAGTLLAVHGGRAAAWFDDATPAAPGATPTAAAPAPADSLFYRLGASDPVRFASGAAVQFARAAEFPALSGLSLALFDVDADATREMHWHTNAGELGWVLGGAGQMVIVDDAGAPVLFALGPGSVFFAPKGLPHAFWTTGQEPLQILLGFDHQQPTTIDFSQMMPPLPPAVIAQAAGVAVGDVPAFPTVAKPFAAPVPGGTAELPVAADDPRAARYTARIENVVEETYAGGARSMVTAVDIQFLTGIKTTLLTLDPGATREPHWHPAMDEVSFILDGQVEVVIVGPNGATQTEVLTAGDVGFVPVNWLHYLGNVGEAPAEVIIFHDATTTQAIELSWALAGFPPAILAASYGLEPSTLAELAGGEAPLIAGPPDEGPAGDTP